MSARQAAGGQGGEPEPTPSFLVYGAGAMGSLFGGRLAQAGCQVTLLGRRAQVEAIRRRGLLVTGLTEAALKLEGVARLEELPSAYRPDYILVTVKAYDTAGVAAELAAWEGLEKGRAVVSLQNGLDNLPTLADKLGSCRLLGGLTSHGATFVDWGHVHHAGTGYTVVGEYERVEAGGEARGEASPLLQGLAAALNGAGFETEVTDNLAGEVWAKGLVNCAINPVTALAGVPNGGLSQGPLRELARRACLEAAAVAQASGIQLPPGDPWARVAGVISATAANRSSMLQDVERGRPTEVAAINGAVVRQGRRLGLPVQVNWTLWKLVEGLQAAFTEP